LVSDDPADLSLPQDEIDEFYKSADKFKW
jgi:hypothetical protein